MGLDYRILKTKPTVNRNGETSLDLLSSVIDPSLSMGGQMVIVNKYYVARPDLLSLAMYGEDRFGDIICKVNGISNPFELNEDDVVFIPDIEYVTDCIKTPTPSTFIKDDEKETVGKKNLDTLRKPARSMRSGNEQTTADRNYIIDKSLGMIFY